MKKLTILRHAKAVEATTSGDDHDRALAERGRKAAEAVGQATVGAIPQLILCSSARRTQETLISVSSAWPAKPNVLVDKSLYLASANRLLGRIAEIDDSINDVWLIGHNPGLHDLARHLASHAAGSTRFPDLAYRFPTSARAIFESEAPQWREFAEGPLALIDVRF